MCLSRSCAGFSCRGSKDRYPACKIGARHFCCHGVSLRVPLHAQGTQTLSCAFSHDHLQIMPHLSFCPSGSGSEAGWWAGFGAGDGSGSNCRRRVSESCACESLPATRYCMRHPKSTGKQGFAGYSTFADMVVSLSQKYYMICVSIAQVYLCIRPIKCNSTT